jgi:hypothetical protein
MSFHNVIVVGGGIVGAAIMIELAISEAEGVGAGREGEFGGAIRRRRMGVKNETAGLDRVGDYGPDEAVHANRR